MLCLRNRKAFKLIYSNLKFMMKLFIEITRNQGKQKIIKRY